MSAVGQSLHEARELYTLLQAIENKFQDVELKAKQTRPELMEVLALTYQMIDTLSAFGAGNTIDMIVKNLRKVIYLINLVNISWRALTASTPIGWVLGGLGALTGAAAYVAAEGHMRS